MYLDSILPAPDILIAKKVLCIQPHYDDNDIGAGGTYARLARDGTELIYLTVTDDLMGVVDVTLPEAQARGALARDQQRAGEIIGVKEQVQLDYPDAGDRSTSALRNDILKYIRLHKPDFIFSPDPWMTYEAHHDHVQTGLAAAEAVMFANLLKIPSSDPNVDARYQPYEIKGIVFYYTREPNLVVDITTTWETKLAALQCYETQFTPDALQELAMALMGKSMQVCAEKAFKFGEPFKVLHPAALHCGI